MFQNMSENRIIIKIVLILKCWLKILRNITWSTVHFNGSLGWLKFMGRMTLRPPHPLLSSRSLQLSCSRHMATTPHSSSRYRSHSAWDVWLRAAAGLPYTPRARPVELQVSLSPDRHWPSPISPSSDSVALNVLTQLAEYHKPLSSNYLQLVFYCISI